MIVAAARELLGTPFHHQGRQPGVGVDCAGVAIVVCQRLGIPHLDMPAYGRRPQGGRLEAQLDAQPGLVRIPVADAIAGDLLLLRFTADPQHLGILAEIDGEPSLIHAYEAAGAVVEHRLDAAWRRRIVRAYRFTVGT